MHDVISHPRYHSEQPQNTAESLWVATGAIAQQKGLRLGPWGIERTLWFIWRELVEPNLLYPVLVWKIEDEAPRCQQTILLRRQARFGTDPVLCQSYVSSIDPAIRTVVESVLDRGVETNETKARWELQLESHSFHLEEGDLITAEIIRAELRECEESVNQ